MILYRTIGYAELQAILIDGHVHGRYNNSTEKQNNSNLKKVCCFFNEEIHWQDGTHEYFIVVDIPEDKVVGTGVGTYYASKSFAKTKIWTGRRGSEEYKLDEVYTSGYSIENIKEIHGLHKFTDTYINAEIKPLLDPYGIKIV